MTVELKEDPTTGSLLLHWSSSRSLSLLLAHLAHRSSVKQGREQKWVGRASGRPYLEYLEYVPYLEAQSLECIKEFQARHTWRLCLRLTESRLGMHPDGGQEDEMEQAMYVEITESEARVQVYKKKYKQEQESKKHV